MASLASLRTSTRRLLDETDSSNSNFDDTELNDYLNQAQRKAATELEFPLTTATATSATGQAQYSLPDNCMLVVGVFFDGKRINFIDLEDMAAQDENYRNAANDQPTIAYRSGKTSLGLYRPPSTPFAGKTILIEYIKYAGDMSADSDSPDLQTVIQDILPYWAANLAMIRAGNFKSADYFRGLYAEEMKLLKPRVIKFAEDYLGMRWE